MTETNLTTRGLVERNRTVLRQTIPTVGPVLDDPASQIGVAQIGLPADGPDAWLLYKDLLKRGAHVLPCAPFHWTTPEEGLRFIRLSQARPFETVQAASRALADTYRALSAA